MRALCVALAIAVGMKAQSLPERRFEAASVKPIGLWRFRSMTGGPGTSSPGQIIFTGQSLKNLLFIAFRVQFFRMDTQPWMEGERFDIIAKVPAGSTFDDLRAMLRNLLAERFGLRFHRENKERPGYALRLGAAKPKLVEAAAVEESPPAEPGGHLRLKRAPTAIWCSHRERKTSSLCLTRMAFRCSRRPDLP